MHNVIGMGILYRNKNTMGARQPWRIGTILRLMTLALMVTACDREMPSAIEADETTEDPSQWYAPEPGFQQVCTIAFEGTIELDSGFLSYAVDPNVITPNLGELKNHNYTASMKLHTRILGEEDGNIVVAMGFKDYDVVVDDAQEDRTDIFETPFLVHINGKGAIAAYEFPRAFPSDAVRRIRDTVEAAQVVGPEHDGSSEWKSTEMTVKGQREVTYAITSAEQAVISLHRKVVSAYEPNAILGDEVASLLSTRINYSKGEVVWSANGPMHISYMDDIENFLNDTPLDHKKVKFKMNCEKETTDELPASLDEARDLLETDAFVVASSYEVPGNMEEQLEKFTPEEIIADFEETLDSSQSSATTRLKYWLRLHPGQTQTLVDNAVGVELSKENKRKIAYVFAAVTSAGHREAQNTITAVIDGDGYAFALRDLAVRSTMGLTAPGPELVEAVWDYRRELDAMATPVNPTVRSMGTTIYGTLGNPRHGNPSITARVVNNLQLLLESATSRQDTADVLAALGNVGAIDEVLPIVEAYFSSSDERLRAYAFSVFQTVRGDDGFDAFLGRYLNEDSHEVRLFAVAVLTSMPYSFNRNLWLQSEVFVEPDPTVLTKYTTVLGDAITIHPENKTVLYDMLNVIRDRSVRKTIYQYVAPRAKGGA